jgi:CRISPR-associated protein Cas2
MYYVAVYDVSVDRVGAMLKIFRRYLTWVQNSVFEGELTDAQLARLKSEAEALMEPDEDSIIFWGVQNRTIVERETLGRERGTTGRML